MTQEVLTVLECDRVRNSFMPRCAAFPEAAGRYGTNLTAQQLRAAAAKSKDARAARRMLAIALVLDSADRKMATESCGMDRQTLRDWVHRYNAEGLPSLSNRRPCGSSCLLSPTQNEDLATGVPNGPDPATDDSCAVRGKPLEVWFQE